MDGDPAGTRNGPPWLIAGFEGPVARSVGDATAIGSEEGDCAGEGAGFFREGVGTESMTNPAGATARRGWFNASEFPPSARATRASGLGQACRLYAFRFSAFKFPTIVGDVPPS